MLKLLVFCLIALASGASGNTSSNTGQSASGSELQAARANLQAAFRNVGSWFTRQYRTVQGWFATSKQDLERKVQDMVTFLDQVKQNANTLTQGASQQLQASVQNVNRFYDDVVQFQTKVRTDASASFQALEAEWQNKVQNMYNGGLDKIVDAAQAAKAAPPAAGSAQAGSAK